MSQNDHEQLTKSILCINDRKLTIHKNIIESYTGTIVIYVSGLLLIPSLDGQKTPLGLKTASTIIGAHVTDISPWIIFAMPGQKDRKAFTFGQEPDQYDLNRVIKAVVQKNPAANIILMGTCLGSTTILNYLANPTYNSQQYFNAIKSAILESPAISFDNIQKHITTQLSYLLRPAMFWILSKYYPKYTKEKDTENILTSYQRIPVHISFLIGYSKHDAITSSKETKLIAEYLQKNGINVLLFENKNPKTAHGDLKYNIYFHKAIKSFISE